MNSLFEYYPELLEEWDYEKNIVKPKEVSFGSHKKVWWKCKEGHFWQASPNSRTNKKSGCPFCSGYKVSGKNILAVTHPELMEEWDYENNVFRPEEVSYGSAKKVRWKCKKGHSWQARPNSRTNKKSGCPFCSGNKVSMKKNLTVTHPELVEEWDYEKNIVSPSEVSFGSKKEIWWRCQEGHSWEATPNARTNMKSGCPFCSGYKASEKNNIALTHPHLLEEWNYKKNIIKPSEISYGSARKVWWECKEGHTWLLSVKLKASRKSPCPYC